MARLTIDDLLDRARRDLVRVTPAQAHEAMQAGAFVVDIRSDSQIAADGTVPGAAVIPRNVLEWRLDPDSDVRVAGGPELDGHVIVMCNEGYASSLVAQTLRQLGFAAATDLDGGFQAWRAAGLPVTPPGE
jgi:rhodanese-related sulfurtransferase